MDIWTSDLNYAAVAVAAFANVLIGSLWYSPIMFGGAWLKLIGKTQADVAAMGNRNRSYVVAVVCALVAAYVLALLIKATGSGTALGGIVTGLWVWLGFIATNTLVRTMFLGAPMRLYLLDGGNHLVALVLMGLVLGAW